MMTAALVGWLGEKGIQISFIAYIFCDASDRKCGSIEREHKKHMLGFRSIPKMATPYLYNKHGQIPGVESLTCAFCAAVLLNHIFDPMHHKKWKL